MPTYSAYPERGSSGAPSLVLAAMLLGLAGCAEPPPPNFLLVSLDTVRADRVGGEDRQGTPITPILDQFATEARVFHKAFAYSNETLLSHSSLFLARYPSEIAPLDYASFSLRLDSPTLAALLSRAGYRTVGVVAGGHLRPNFGLQAGFQEYTSVGDFDSFQATIPLALDKLETLGDGDRPFMLLVHGYDAHTPYAKPGPFFKLGAPGYEGALLDASRSAFSYEQLYQDVWYPEYEVPVVLGDNNLMFPSASAFESLAAYAREHPDQGIPLSQNDLDFLIGTYDSAVRLVDFHVGRLLEGLDELGMADNTVVVIFSDHGEDLLDHGFCNHRVSLHDENNQVAILLRGPGVPPGDVYDPVSLSDITPTVLELAGAASPDTRARSLLGFTDPERAIFSEAMRGLVSVRTSEGRLILPKMIDPATVLEQKPHGAFLLDDDNQEQPWDSPLTARLFQALQEQQP